MPEMTTDEKTKLLQERADALANAMHDYLTGELALPRDAMIQALNLYDADFPGRAWR